MLERFGKAVLKAVYINGWMDSELFVESKLHSYHIDSRQVKRPVAILKMDSKLMLLLKLQTSAIITALFCTALHIIL